ncbi:MAG TPA: hypothetical protein ENJ38_05230 [Rhodospirillales bacterium]|nr:hypothetical protein [Rhodospirillales bacterium]
MTAAGIPCGWPPERRTRLGLPPGIAVVEGAMAWWSTCSCCGRGGVPLLPDADGRLVPSPIGTCFGRRGWRCSSRRVAECWRALCEGREIEPTEAECRLVGALLVRRFPALWHGRQGRDPRAALWAVARELDELETPPRLIRLALETLAARREWPPHLAREVWR